MRNQILLTCLLIFVTSNFLVACRFGDRHHFFLDQQKNYIGKTVDQYNNSMLYGDSDRRLSDVALPNGQRVAKYWYAKGKTRQCIEVVYYDPISRKIMRMDFEGKPEHCLVSP